MARFFCLPSRPLSLPFLFLCQRPASVRPMIRLHAHGDLREWTCVPLMPSLSFSCTQTHKVRKCSANILFVIQAAGETYESVIRNELGDNPDVSKTLRDK